MSQNDDDDDDDAASPKPKQTGTKHEKPRRQLV